MNRTIGLLIGRVINNAMAVALFIVVGRLLTPEAFATYAIASGLVILFMTSAAGGLIEYVISRDPEGRNERTAAWLGAFAGVAGVAFTFALGGALWAFGSAEMRQVAPLLLALSPLPLMSGVCAVPEARLVRDNRGGWMALVYVAAEVAGFVALLAAFAAGAGVYALVWNRLINALALFIVYFGIFRTPVFGRFDAAAAPEILRFSFGLIGTRLLQWIDGYGQDLLLVRTLSFSALGQFRMGARLNASVIAITIGAPAPAQLAYTGERFARFPHRIGATALRVARLHAVIITPVFFGLGAVAFELVPLLLGDRWGQTAAVLAAACLLAPFFAVGGAFTATLTAQGRTKKLFMFNTAIILTSSAALALGGLFGAAGAMLARTIVLAIGTTALMAGSKQLPAPARARVLRSVGAIALAGAGLVAAARAVIAATPAQGPIAQWAELALAGTAGVLVYVALVRLIAPGTWRQLRTLVGGYLRKRTAKRHGAGVAASSPPEPTFAGPDAIRN